MKNGIGSWLLKNAGSTAIQIINYNYYPLLSSGKEDSGLDGTADSRNGLEAWLAGMEATDGITMMFGVHGAEEIGGSLVLGLVLSAAPMHEQAVAEAPKHSHDAHGLWFADPALIV